MRTLLIPLILVAMLLSGCGAPVTIPTPTPPPVSPEEQKLQERRYAFIQDNIAKGIFLKVEQPADFPHVWVTPVFYTLNFEDKQAFISVVYAYYSTQYPEADMVVLYDSKTGKKVGVFAEVYGGLKLD